MRTRSIGCIYISESSTWILDFLGGIGWLSRCVTLETLDGCRFYRRKNKQTNKREVENPTQPRKQTPTAPRQRPKKNPPRMHTQDSNRLGTREKTGQDWKSKKGWCGVLRRGKSRMPIGTTPGLRAAPGISSDSSRSSYRPQRAHWGAFSITVYDGGGPVAGKDHSHGGQTEEDEKPRPQIVSGLLDIADSNQKGSIWCHTLWTLTWMYFLFASVQVLWIFIAIRWAILKVAKEENPPLSRFQPFHLVLSHSFFFLFSLLGRIRGGLFVWKDVFVFSLPLAMFWFPCLLIRSFQGIRYHELQLLLWER